MKNENLHNVKGCSEFMNGESSMRYFIWKCRNTGNFPRESDVTVILSNILLLACLEVKVTDASFSH